jgi:3,4-dihydroxy 2-butanone 4-phosphate synthase / GTP cyclohydrolase II
MDVPMTTDMQRVVEAIRAFEQGEMIVVTDDDDRENEGDLILAAVHATPEKIAFIIRHTSGIVCAPMTRETARRLRLAPMVADSDAPLGTAFTVSVDFRHGLTTGISAEERCNTVRALANPNAGANDFARPGHVFPLIAKEGGVLTRSGHTEAAVDLARLADLTTVGVLAELVNDDGTVKRGPQVTAFAEAHKLRQVSVADLIAYRQRSERLVERVGEFPVLTSAGPARAIAYRTEWDPMQHLALVFGNIVSGRGVPVRFHHESVVNDVFAAKSGLDRVMARLAASGGVLVYLREGAVGVVTQSGRTRDEAIGVAADPATSNEDHGSAAIRREQWREIGLGAQILKDLGVTSIRLLATRARRYVGLDGFGIVIDETEILEG